MARLIRLLRALPLLILSPLLLLAAGLGLALTDLLWRITRRRCPQESEPRIDEPDQSLTFSRPASVVIPNWNGQLLLEKYLPSVEAALAGHPENEIIVVDNGSTDGSADFVRQQFPRVKVLALERNLGFGGGSNAGIRAAKNDIVVLLNSDMRVTPDFLAPLVEGFRDKRVFAVSCQIFFSDAKKVREETGLTHGWWEDGGLRVRHRIDDAITDLFPCFYGGGGSCAFDRKKFLELGGFDPLLAPFYLEDTDLSYMAWKRGWTVLYQPRSIVYHEHRGTIGKKFSEQQIQAVLNKNYILFCWKNIHEWSRLLSHIWFTWAGAIVGVFFGDVPGRASLTGIWMAFLQLPRALGSRWRARSLAAVDDTETFRRPLGGYFRDRFDVIPAQAERPRVLFVSPYPICPPVHGGGVFMYQTLVQLASLCEVHVIAMLDRPDQRAANEALTELCASAELLVRTEAPSSSAGSLLPYAVREFASAELEWLIHRQLYLKKIDVLQLEYTVLGQYVGRYRRMASFLFEHDVYFQSVARGLNHLFGLSVKSKAVFEYLRALRYELGILPRFDRVQVCTHENKDYLVSFLPNLEPRIQNGLRAGIDTRQYEFGTAGREPFAMLFVGSFRHGPNSVALEWFVRQVLPIILARRPEARLLVAGSEPPPRHAFGDFFESIELLGFVDDVRTLLARCSVFVCPILSGSGVRVKLLEAFASGIPVVSTRIGAEGLARKDGEFCLLADEPGGFADRVLELFDDPEKACLMAKRARTEMEENWDMAAITRKLVASYHEVLREKREVACR